MSGSDRKKILIADDDRALVGVLTARLTDAGYDVVSASDGRYAFDRIVQETPDLVILDIHMPVVSGFNVLERMYKRTALEGVPVIYVSGDISEEVDRTARHFGAYALIRKPFEIDHLMAAVRGALGRKE
jgi:DNA-binding response OmpR family regulator